VHLMEYVRIPKDRVAVLIGKNGETKKEIEQRTGARISVDSSEGEVEVDTSKVFEPIFSLTVLDIIKAIGRGLAPEKALRLLQENVYLRIVDIREYAGKNKNRIVRLRSRVIGSKGKTRKTIEKITGADISIQGNTVVILGELYEVEIAETALDMLLNGAEHSSVYRFLEGKRKQLKMAQLEF
jgi:ribosomal RNA assembly protein